MRNCSPASRTLRGLPKPKHRQMIRRSTSTRHTGRHFGRRARPAQTVPSLSRSRPAIATQGRRRVSVAVASTGRVVTLPQHAGGAVCEDAGRQKGRHAAKRRSRTRTTGRPCDPLAARSARCCGPSAVSIPANIPEPPRNRPATPSGFGACRPHSRIFAVHEGNRGERLENQQTRGISAACGPMCGPHTAPIPSFVPIETRRMPSRTHVCCPGQVE